MHQPQQFCSLQDEAQEVVKRQIINLAKAIPEDDKQQQWSSLRALCQQVRALEDDFLGEEWIHKDELLLAPDLPECTGAALLTIRQGQAYEQTLVRHFYTDGSAPCPIKEVTDAAWACVVIDELSDGTFIFRGATCRRLSASIQDSVGEQSGSAASAEAVAVVWALLFSARARGIERVEVHFDNMPVGFSVMGRWVWRSSATEQRVVAAAVALCQWVSAFQGIHGQHCKAHSGQPWNECADFLAGAQRYRSNRWEPHGVETQLVGHRLRDWAWSLELHASYMPFPGNSLAF